MKNQNKTKLTWWERNKNKVLIAGGIVIAAGIGIVIFNNKDALTDFLKNGSKAVSVEKPPVPKAIAPAVPAITETISDTVSEKSTVPTLINNGLPFFVNGSIRNLPDNYFPSPEKKALAECLGITLGEHQTIVDSYWKNKDKAA